MKFSRILFLLLLLAVVFSQKPANKADGSYVEGEAIVMMQSLKGSQRDAMISSLAADFAYAELEPVRLLSPRMNIWLVKFNPGSMSSRSAPELLKAHPKVIEAQHNHYIELRETFPVDDYFDDQWNLHNTGQTGGIADADIDAPEAWDFTTGGFTALGDTIILAIVDDGFDLDHSDILYWKNWRDIPGNGIDDDTNGYVDDYHGWNSWTHSGNLPMRDHGTHVAGIAAAIGNNDRGVAGINWNARVMPIVGSATVESIVVEAYGYVYEMRARYNETGGEEGAFIVCTNSSFGVNQGQPEDYPIWGAMYDSLGMVGILSAGATANATWNVDEVGDIPTAFDNEHLITVTNTTPFDEKNVGAAFGPTTIDLGAPGTSVYSTRQNDSYGTKTGTSMASPHLAGAIALMYAAADSAFIASYHADPANVSLLVKDYLLLGVDPLPSLEGITVTGGRLNLYNSIMMLLQPGIEINPGTLNVEMFPGRTYQTGFELLNSGETEVEFTAEVENPSTWISIDPVSGTVPANSQATVSVDFDTENIPGGEYTNRVIVNSMDQDHYLDIFLNVIPPLLPDSDTLETVIETGDSGETGLNITNITDEPVFFKVRLQGSTTWIEFGPLNGTLEPGEGQDITILIETLGIQPGIYEKMLEIEYDDLGVIEIPLIIEILIPPLNISLDSLYAEMEPNDQLNVIFTLKNNTPDPLLFTIGMEIQELWMSYEPGEGTIVPNGNISIDFGFNSQALIPSIYENNLIITYNETQEKKIPVRLDVINTGINEQQIIREFSVMPNPVGEKAVISFTLQEKVFLKAGIFTLSGEPVQLISEREFDAGKNTILWQPGQDLAAGIYLVILDGNGFSAARKVILN